MSEEAPMKMRAPAVSMGNSLNNIDSSVNVQGDGEIGKYRQTIQKTLTL